MDAAKFADYLLTLLDETFENHHGIYTYKGTSLLETLDTITAAEASIPVGGQCPTLAAQVAHTAFYMEVLEPQLRGEEVGEVDWEQIWQTVGAVTPDEWEASKAHLKQTYEKVLATVRGFDSWEPESRLWTLDILVHTAYHLGAIRQALCIVRSDREK